MRTVLSNVLAGLLVAVTLNSVAAQSRIPWLEDVQQAQSIASQEGRLVLIHFYSDSCPPCQRLEQVVFPHGEVCRAMAMNYVPVKINADRDRATARQFQVDRWPTDVIADAQGRVIYTTVSPQDPRRYVQLLNAVAADFRATMGPVAAGDRPAPTAAPAANHAFAAYNQPAVSPGPQAYPGGPPRNEPAYTAGTADPYMAQRPTPASPPPPAPREQVNPYAVGYGPGSMAGGSPQATAYDPRSSWAPPAAGGAGPPESAARQAPAMPPDPIAGSQPQWQPNHFVANPHVPVASGTNEPANASPVVSPGAGSQYALDGYCPVTLLEQESWVRGDPRWGILHRGSVYLFLSEQHLQRFHADPDRYAPVLSGFDPTRYIDRGELVPGKRAYGNWFRGKTYLFADKASQERFEQMPDYYAQRAHEIMMAAGR